MGGRDGGKLKPLKVISTRKGRQHKLTVGCIRLPRKLKLRKLRKNRHSKQKRNRKKKH
jgi:hypothetical protein